MRKSVVYRLFPAFLIWMATLPGHSTVDWSRSTTAAEEYGNGFRPGDRQRRSESRFQFIEPIKGQSVQSKLRDPFDRSDRGIGLQKRHPSRSRFEGLVTEDGETFAIVRGKKVAPGDRILGMRVIRIQNDRVVLANQKKIRIFYLF